MSIRKLAWLAGVSLLGAAGMSYPQAVGGLRQVELVRLVRQDCGSCHGLTLKGGLGPPLTARALKDKSPEMLRAVILRGRPGTPMPPWNAFMSEQDADWIVEQLLKGFPNER